MKNVDPRFEGWWSLQQSKMASDPLMKFFNEGRNAVLKEGLLSTTSYLEVGAGQTVDIGALIRTLKSSAPPNTVGVFLGDPLGGNGWRVRMPDGSEENVYSDLPDVPGLDIGLKFDNPPTEHFGKLIKDTSIANLGRIYVLTLNRVVEEFIAQFEE